MPFGSSLSIHLFVCTGKDGAGVVEALGEEVKNFTVGQRVWLGATFSWCCLLKDNSPTAESFGVSAKLGPGALWGSHPARFCEVPRFQVKVLEGSKMFQVRVPATVLSTGPERVPRKGKVPSKGSRRFQSFKVRRGSK